MARIELAGIELAGIELAGIEFAGIEFAGIKLEKDRWMFDKQQNGAGSAEGFDSDGGDIWKRSTNAIKAAESEAQQHPDDDAEEAVAPAPTETHSPANRIDRVARSAATGQAAPEGSPETPPPAQPPMPEPPARPAPMASPEPAPRPEPVESPAPGPVQPAAMVAEAAPPVERPAEQAEPAVAHGSAPDSGPADAQTTAPGQTLTVGRGIRLVAKACECDGLMVEGHLEATAQARTLTVSKGGSFIGSAAVATAEIHGTFEGNLTVSERLTIHSNGSVSGTTRYQEIVIEAGGQISGNTQCLGASPKNGG